MEKCESDIKIKKGVWAVIYYKSFRQYCLICFRDDGKTFNWGQTRSWCVWSEKEFSLVDVIGEVPSAVWDKLEMEFDKKYSYPIHTKKCEQSSGWLSPDGKFYSCSYHEHRRLAYLIATFLYEELPSSPSDFLEQKGWLSVTMSGNVYGLLTRQSDEGITVEQKTILARMSKRGDETWEERINAFIKSCG
jgi:hypothetical protein